MHKYALTLLFVQLFCLLLTQLFPNHTRDYLYNFSPQSDGNNMTKVLETAYSYFMGENRTETARDRGTFLSFVLIAKLHKQHITRQLWLLSSYKPASGIVVIHCSDWMVRVVSAHL